MTQTRKDSDIQKDILNELKWEPSVKETDIGVIVKEGAVTLTGFVPSYMDKLSAMRATKRISGVRAIADEIEVRLPAQMEGSDEEIALRIAHIFDWSSYISAEDIKAEVRKGIVTLSGDVDWQYQKNYAQSQLVTIKGVKSIINNINIRKRAAILDVKHEIEAALRRHANIEASKVNVAITGGTVTLSGDIDSYPERDLVENAVWSAPGVVKVVDNLHVA